MTDLMQMQNQFQNFLISGHTEIETSIVSTEKVSVDTRLDIYRQAYQIRLVDCLASNFPSLRIYLGDEELNKLGNAYLKAHPSNFRSIRWFGDMLPDFITTNYDEEYAYLAELADFEWKMTLAFDAVDDVILSIEDMAVISPEAWADLRFSLHSSVQRMNYFWNVAPIWQTLINDQDLPEWNKNDTAVPWILWRAPNYTIQFYSLSEEEAWALDAIKNGLSFAQLCEGLCHWLDEKDVGMRAATYLKGWIQKGMLRIASG